LPQNFDECCQTNSVRLLIEKLTVIVFYQIAYYMVLIIIAFSALTLLVGHQEEHPAHKIFKVMSCWHVCLEQGANDAIATPSSFASLKSRLV